MIISAVSRERERERERENVIPSILTLILRRFRTEWYGSTLLPATREQHDQNCTQSH